MLLPITTGLSIALMDNLDAYRATGIKTIASYQFAEDIELALRQELSTTVDEAVAAIAKNPRSAATVATATELRIPQITTVNQQVLGFTADPVVAPPAQGNNFYLG